MRMIGYLTPTQFHETLRILSLNFDKVVTYLRLVCAEADHHNRALERIGVDSGGSPGTCPPIIKKGAKHLFWPPPIIRREFFIFLFKKENMKESRNRDKEREIQRKGSKFWMKGVNFWKRSSKILENKGNFFSNFFRMLSENIVSQNFAPPNIFDSNFCPFNIYDKSTPVLERSIYRWTAV